jgi:hypothetical protein
MLPVHQVCVTEAARQPAARGAGELHEYVQVRMPQGASALTPDDKLLMRFSGTWSQVVRWMRLRIHDQSQGAANTHYSQIVVSLIILRFSFNTESVIVLVYGHK